MRGRGKIDLFFNVVFVCCCSFVVVVVVSKKIERKYLIDHKKSEKKIPFLFVNILKSK